MSGLSNLFFSRAFRRVDTRTSKTVWTAARVAIELFHALAHQPSMAEGHCESAAVQPFASLGTRYHDDAFHAPSAGSSHLALYPSTPADAPHHVETSGASPEPNNCARYVTVSEEMLCVVDE